MSGVNWSMGYPEPSEGEVIWMHCPYQADLCGAEATMTVDTITEDEVSGIVTCANDHRWRVSRLADAAALDGEEPNG
jgi:hypothetical protein